MSSTVAFRTMRDEDKNFVLKSWLESFRHSKWAGLVPMSDYSNIYSSIVMSLLEREGCECLIACNIDDESQIFAFLVHEQGFAEPLVHYAYTKQSFRRFGLIKRLFEVAKISCNGNLQFTFMTKVAESLTRRGGKYPRARWNPLYARHSKTETLLLEQRKHEA